MNTTFKPHLLLCSALLSLGMNIAQADEAPALPSISRAEVLADLEIWRESGAASAQGNGESADPEAPAFRQAIARYHTLRAAPDFAVRVERIARQRGERAVLAKQKN
jgi:hypothetical protein